MGEVIALIRLMPGNVISDEELNEIHNTIMIRGTKMIR